MRSPLLLVVFLALTPAAFAVPGAGPRTVQVSPDAPADWRRDAADERVKAALLAKGWRLEDDGKTLDPKTKAPVTKAILDKAVLDLTQDARRAALEAVNLMYAGGTPPVEMREKLANLATELPPGLAAAIQDPKSDPAKIRAMANGELDKVAAYFDGNRTLADRQAAAQPVAAVPLGPRVDLPYYTAREQTAGEKLRGAAQTEIARDPFGKTVLSRLNGPGGAPDLPSFLIEDQQSGVVAQYDYNRKAVVLDREAVLASVVGTVPPRARTALRQSLLKKSDLLDYLDKHPAAMEAVVKDNDVVIVHELTHAWQDRRDPIFREIARGNLPSTQPLEYEEEAWVTKNLYVRSKVQNDPASVKMDEEFKDFVAMSHGFGSWRTALESRIVKDSPSRALSIQSMRDVQAARTARVANRAVTTSADQQAKSLDLAALTRAQRELESLQTAHDARMKPIEADAKKFMAERFTPLGTFYLGRALTTSSAIDRSVLLDQAERYAKASGNAKLIEEVRKAKEAK